MGSIHDLLPERTNTVAVQVSAAGHVPVAHDDAACTALGSLVRALMTN